MVTTEHNGTHLSISYHLVETESDLKATHGILIEDTGLSADHESIFLGVANPIIVVTVLTTAIRIDTLHSSLIGLDQILMLAAETHPTEWAISIIEEHRTHNIFYIRRPNEAIFLIHTISRDLLDSGVVYGFHERISIVEEISATSHKSLDCLEMATQRLVDELMEASGIVMEQFSALFESQSDGAIPTLVNSVT